MLVQVIVLLHKIIQNFFYFLSTTEGTKFGEYCCETRGAI